MMKRYFFAICGMLLLLTACNNPNIDQDTVADTAVLTIPALTAVNLQGEPLRVVATTSIIGDVVAQVGGNAIDLTVLMAAGQDPHSYEPGARDLTAVADAHVIFINGWNLEEGLLDNLANVNESGAIVPVSTGITPRELDPNDTDDEAHSHHEDPHVWLDPHNVLQWVKNIEQVLMALDPDNAPTYQANAAAYNQKLEALINEMDATLADVNGRSLVTNHDALGYLTDRYHLQVIGTVLPGASTLAEPSATDLAELATNMSAADTCTIFAESTANTQLAAAVAAELENCEQVQILSLYTGAIGPVGSGADSYIGMMQADLQMLVEGLQ